MTTSLRPLDARAILGRTEWLSPEPFGPDGWRFDRKDRTARIIATVAEAPDGSREWLHVSISRPDRMPEYADLTLLHRAFYGDRWAYQVFAPPNAHVNIHPFALHLWGLLDGSPLLPNFGSAGSI